MKKLSLTLALIVAASVNVALSQNGDPVSYLDRLPKNLKLDNSIVRSYRIITDYMNYDMKGNFADKKRLSGKITYGLKGDSARWEDVYVASSGDLNAPFPRGTRQDYMQNFKYKPTEEIITEEFFQKIPQADVQIQNLIWDMFGFDVFAYFCWDSLKLNREYRAKEINSEVNIAGLGTFENKDTRITWTGITKMNEEICAIIKYSVMNNPLKIELDNLSLTGRSHYWGEVYVSLTDKEIEYACLTEDVLTDVKIDGMPDNIQGYTVRKIEVTRDE